MAAVLFSGLVGALLVLGIAWIISESCDHFDMDRAIGRGIAAGIGDALEEAGKPGGSFDQMIWSALRQQAEEARPVVGNLRPAAFVWQVAFEFLRTDPQMQVLEARDLAVDTVKAFLKDEKVKYGHADYAWDQSAAITLAREYEIEHWEART